MLTYIYSLLRYNSDNSIPSDNKIDLNLQKNIHNFKKKRAVRIIEQSYINYLKRKAIRKKKKEKRKL